MGKIKKIRLPDGQFFYVEVREPEMAINLRDLPASDEPPNIRTIRENTADTVNAATGTIAAAVSFIFNELYENPPDELVLEFCIDFQGKSAIPIILMGDTKAAFKITATWIKSGDEDEEWMT